MEDIPKLVDDYYHWLRAETKITHCKEWHIMTTPMLDYNNDCIEIYVKKQENNLLYLTDDGETLDELGMCGVSFNRSPNRLKILKTILNGFGISLDGKCLCTTASEDNFAEQKHNLLQAILSVQDMFMLSNDSVKNIFTDDVKRWLQSQDIAFTTDALFKGRSGYARKFSFTIPPFKGKPERLINALNHPNKKSYIDNLLMAWIDVKDMREAAVEAKSDFYVVMNDNEPIKQTSLAACRHYGIIGIPWSEKENYIQALRN